MKKTRPETFNLAVFAPVVLIWERVINTTDEQSRSWLDWAGISNRTKKLNKKSIVKQWIIIRRLCQGVLTWFDLKCSSWHISFGQTVEIQRHWEHPHTWRTDLSRDHRARYLDHTERGRDCIPQWRGHEASKRVEQVSEDYFRYRG